MTKSKKFWAASALISLAVMVFAGYTLYGRMALHFSGDTLEVRPVPVPVPQEDEDAAAAATAAARAAALAKMEEEDKKEDKEEEARAGKQPAAAKAEGEKVRAVKTSFEYKSAAAKAVFISGSFTSWKEKKMTKANGVWKAEIYILPGTYPYHFTVDGKKTLDPGKPKAPTGDSLVNVN